MGRHFNNKVRNKASGMVRQMLPIGDVLSRRPQVDLRSAYVCTFFLPDHGHSRGSIFHHMFAVGRGAFKGVRLLS